MNASRVPFAYKIIRSRRKTVAIVVNARGEVTVRAPLRAARALIEAFVLSKQGWVLQKLAEVERYAAGHPLHRFQPGEMFPFQGRYYPLEITPAARPALVWDGRSFRLSAAARPRAPREFTAWYRARAGELVRARVAVFAARYGFTFQKLRITSARTRWGSCTSRATLSFSWRVAILPPDLLDYVAVHELCHLRQPNHSPAFWLEVQRILPDALARRKALAAWGGQLNWD